MTSCSTSTPWKTLTRSGAIVVVFGLGLASSGLSYAATGTMSTVQALIAGDGSVTSVSRLGGDSNAKPNASEIPVKLAISASNAGDARTTTYRVENTTSKTEKVRVTKPDGTSTMVAQEIQTPYVAQLHVALPASLTDIAAQGAEIVTNSDGSHDLMWSLVLFSPLGSPVTEVAFSSKGKGNPVARLETAAVSPNGTPGLSATGQAANAIVAGNGTLSTVAAGANAGLTQLAAGVGQIIAGLDTLKSGADKLHTGLAAGADGTKQLAAGLHSAGAGSTALSSGLGQIRDGSGQLAGGTTDLHHGTGQLVGGLQKASDGSVALVNGSQDLATGAGLTAAGAKSLSTGLQQISGGLSQLGAGAGLPAAKIGALALKAGVDQISAGLGSATTPGTILNGLAKIGGGLGQLSSPTTGLPAAKAGADTLIAGVIKLRDGTSLAQGGVEQVRTGLAAATVLNGPIDKIIALASGGAAPGCVINGMPSAAPATACESLNTAVFALSHAAGYQGAADLGGLKEQTAAGAAGLALVGGGLGDIRAGLSTGSTSQPGVLEGLVGLSAGLGQAVAGVGALQAGVSQVTAGVSGVAAGVKSGDVTHPGLSEGLDQLIAGLTAALTGVTQLSTGAASAAAGSVDLAAGTRQVAAGAGKLSEEGAVPLSAGLAQLLAGATKIDSGAGQLDAGAQKLHAGAIAATDGAGQLGAGVGKLSAGADQLAAGLPAAVTGSGQIADGAGQLLAGGKKVGAGLSDLKSKATDVLASQLAAGTENANIQLAGLDAITARLTADPAVANTTYVLTQDNGAFRSVKLSGGDSHVGRNVGLGLGGALLLFGGLAGGFVSGRRRSVV